MSDIFTPTELLALALVPLTSIIGLILHEFSHYVVGIVAGGSPFFSKYTFGVIPREVDFESPDKMSDWGIRTAGGIVYIYPIISLMILIILPNDHLLKFTPLLTLFLGASGVSWFDGLAAQNPQQWRKYTMGEPISRDMLD